MSQLKAMMTREQGKRDKKIRDWMKEGVSQSEMARRLDISRQRMQQIVRRLNGKHSRAQLPV